MYTLRPALMTEYDLLYQIKNESIRPYVEKIWGWDESFQRDFLLKETPIAEVQIILSEGQNVAGFVQTKECEDHLYVGSLFITNSFQSKGIGAAILNDLFLQNEIVRLEVLKINSAALKFYLRHEMQIVDESELKYLLEKKTK